MKNLTEKQLINIVEGRLGLQSTQRELDRYNIPNHNYSFTYFKSPAFAKIFISWDDSKHFPV